MKKNSKKQDSVIDNRNNEPVIVNDDDDEDTESLNSNVASKVRGKKRKLISKVWNYFEILDTKPGEELMCKCKKCGNKYSADSKNGTGNLNRHIQSCVKITTKDIGQFLLSSNQGSLLSRNPQFSQEKFRELLVQALIRHDLPFSFVEYEGIRDLLKYLEPKVSFFSRHTARTDVKKMHASLVSKVRNELSACPGRICLTSDCWSSIVTDGYISLTAHFIDSEWVLHKKILNFSYMPPPHNGVSLAEKIHTLVAYWGIDKKLLSLTLDNASANDSCVNILRSQLKLKDALVYDGSLFHIRCCAHILNLIVQEGLKKIDVSVDKVRECVKYIKGSQIRKDSFRKFIEQISLDDKKGLLQDVPTRWNSTYKMLSSALYYQLSF
ncbi:putative transcription factor/ chromatin remodeling BED-type(Zn) family [Helianthus annuus]|uniref:Transcription factor/ chromatin remodeling BED-type(Zn) family n=2 Tax=Helianthus annuus TaxID=4232 RepID=A0A9K3J6Q6_HELAN|nr:putative transcription factor/ chromatin remodeling BED-type(Zn) family [Helianthus annuus]